MHRMATSRIEMRSVMWLHVELLVIFNVLVIHIFLIFTLNLLNRSRRSLVCSSHGRSSSSMLLRPLVSMLCSASLGRLRCHVLRTVPALASSPLFNGFAEHLLLPANKFLSFPGLPLTYVFEFLQFSHLVLCFFTFLVCDASLPLLFLNFYVFSAILVFFNLKPLEI